MLRAALVVGFFACVAAAPARAQLGDIGGLCEACGLCIGGSFEAFCGDGGVCEKVSGIPGRLCDRAPLRPTSSTTPRPGPAPAREKALALPRRRGGDAVMAF